MAWFRVDDGWWSHPKTLQLSDGAQALWVRAGSWSMKHLTDGEIFDYVLAVLRAKPRHISELLAVGYWVKKGPGYLFHDWEKYQLTREEIEEQRRKDAERKRRQREKQAGRPSDSHGGTGGVTPPASPKTQSNPIQSKPLTTRLNAPSNVSLSSPGSDEYQETVEACRGVAAAFKVDFDKAFSELVRVTGREVHPTQVTQVISEILSRAGSRVKSPTGFVLSSIKTDWAEWQQLIDEGIPDG